jgi:hypothetical protein
MLFSRNLSPLQSSEFSSEYLLLPPRSAPEPVSLIFTDTAASRAPRPPYSHAPRARACGRASVVRLSAIHFQGYCLRQVSCYTLLSGFRLPWPPSCCLKTPTPFVVSDERTLGYLSATFGSSRIASSAYQRWPTLKFRSPRTINQASSASRPFKV